MKKIFCFLVLLLVVNGFGANPSAPTGLMVELMASVQEIYSTDTKPDYSWVVSHREPDEVQIVYQIVAASSLSAIQANTAAGRISSGLGTLSTNKNHVIKLDVDH